MNELAKRVVADELLPVYESESGQHVVDARQLHAFLQVGRDFSTWIKERIDRYGFAQGDDFSPVPGKTSGGRPSTEYVLTIDMAKELCMVENNEMGATARRYFISIEKRFKSSQIQVSTLSPQMQMFHALFESQVQMEQRVNAAVTKAQSAESRAQSAEAKADSLADTVEVIQETFLQRDPDWRNSINSLLNAAAFRTGAEYRTLRSDSYRTLEERAHCDLATRLRNLHKRLEESGATKTQINNTNRMDVIENDPRLKEIYTSVVKELSISSLSVAK